MLCPSFKYLHLIEKYSAVNPVYSNIVEDFGKMKELHNFFHKKRGNPMSF
jgi:hypothetical protein